MVPAGRYKRFSILVSWPLFFLLLSGCITTNVADLGGGVRDVFRSQSLIDGPPGLAAIVGSERSGSGDRGEDAAGIARIEQDGV